MSTCKFTKIALLQILLHVFCLHFLRTHHVTASEEAFKVGEQIFFSENKAKSSVTCNLPVELRSSKSTSFTLNVAFGFVLSTALSSKLEFMATCYKEFTRQNHFVIAKLKKLRILKQKRKNPGIISLTELLVFRDSKYIFRAESGIYCQQSHRFRS